MEGILKNSEAWGQRGHSQTSSRKQEQSLTDMTCWRETAKIAPKKGPQAPVRLFWKHKILWNASALAKAVFLAVCSHGVITFWKPGENLTSYPSAAVGNICTLKSPFSRLQLKLVSLTCVPLFRFRCILPGCKCEMCFFPSWQRP